VISELKDKEVKPTVDPEELASIKVEAKAIKEKFEKAAKEQAARQKSSSPPVVVDSLKKRQFDDEFDKINSISTYLYWCWCNFHG